MSLSVVVKPNADFSSGNITRALLNQAAKPTVAVAGSIGTEEIEALSITEGKIADKTLTGNKLADTTVGIGKLVNLGRGNVLVGQAKSEDDNIDGGDTVTLKLPENGFLVGDGNDVKAMVFDNSSSGAINMSQYTDSSTGDTSFKYELRNLGVRSAHIASRSINLSKLSPNGGTAVTEKTHSAVPTYDGENSPDETNYGIAALTVAGGAGTVLKSNGKENALSFGSVMKHIGTSDNPIGTNGTYQVAHGFQDTADPVVAVKPSLVRVVIICSDTNGDGTFVEGDEVDIYCLQEDNTNSNANRRNVTVDETNISVSVVGSGLECLGKNSSSEVALDESKWKLKVYAAY